MTTLQDMWHMFARRLSIETAQFANRSTPSSRDYTREWHRRQAKALREAREREEKARQH